MALMRNWIRQRSVLTAWTTACLASGALAELLSLPH